MRALLEDYRRDWRRWSRTERLAALALLACLVLGAAAILAAAPHIVVASL